MNSSFDAVYRATMSSFEYKYCESIHRIPHFAMGRTWANRECEQIIFSHLSRVTHSVYIVRIHAGLFSFVVHETALLRTRIANHKMLNIVQQAMASTSSRALSIDISTMSLLFFFVSPSHWIHERLLLPPLSIVYRTNGARGTNLPCTMYEYKWCIAYTACTCERSTTAIRENSNFGVHFSVKKNDFQMLYAVRLCDRKLTGRYFESVSIWFSRGERWAETETFRFRKSELWMNCEFDWLRYGNLKYQKM